MRTPPKQPPLANERIYEAHSTSATPDLRRRQLLGEVRNAPPRGQSPALPQLSIEAAAEWPADVPTRKLAGAARQSRARGKAGFDASFNQPHETEAIAKRDASVPSSRVLIG
ncbi:hypothetical protein [Mesorhizobium carmichaelinearum]|uniref:hypothetical protein n=1 Tax=Mesorhizobium carmichaelinearum TaxID=1208188 RepID=UPI00117EC603|nr:hypothetical protein [Mesorhizobium carmichaelinearum]